MVRPIFFLPAGAAVYLALKLFGVEAAFCQLAAFPFVLGAIWGVSFKGARAPRGMLAACAVLAVAGVGFSKGYKSVDSKSFLLASLAGDEYEAVSRSLRTKLNG